MKVWYANNNYHPPVTRPTVQRSDATISPRTLKKLRTNPLLHSSINIALTFSLCLLCAAVYTFGKDNEWPCIWKKQGQTMTVCLHP